MNYTDIHISIKSDKEKYFYLVTARTTGKNNQTASERFEFSPEQRKSIELNLIAPQTSTTTRSQEQQTRNIGKYLFNCLISGDICRLYDAKKLDAMKKPDKPKMLRIQLTLLPLELISLPWELLYDERDLAYLCLTQEPKIALTRSVNTRGYTINYHPPLRILCMAAASPHEAVSLNAESEKQNLGDALHQLIADKQVDLTSKVGTISQLDGLQANAPHYDVFHYTGYGHFSQFGDQWQGRLAFDDEDKGRSKYVAAKQVYASLHKAGTSLVVLNACQTSHDYHLNHPSNVAHDLATLRIPAVIAMQFTIPDTASIIFWQHLYTQLLQGIPIDEAVAETRRHMHAINPGNLDWAAPILCISTAKALTFTLATTPTTKPRKVFLSYHPADKTMLDELETHLHPLKNQHIITTYHSGNIHPGKEIAEEIERHLNEADIILLLLSHKFLASDYHTKGEMQQALERHYKVEACVIPLILSPCIWETTPLGKLQPLPISGDPITSLPNQNQVFNQIVKDIQHVLDTLPLHQAANTPTSSNSMPKKRPSNGSRKPETQTLVASQSSLLTQDTLQQARSTPLLSTPIQPPSLPNTTSNTSPASHKKNTTLSQLEQRKMVTRFRTHKPVLFWTSIALIFLLATGTAGGIFWYLSRLSSSASSLCSSNAQATTATTPTTKRSPDGEQIGLSEGITVFDRSHSAQELRFKDLAAQAEFTAKPNSSIPGWLDQAVQIDPTDAEAQIYQENWHVLAFHRPYMTFVVGVSFACTDPGTTYGGGNVLRGAFLAQKEYNDQNQNSSKTLIVLSIANVGGDTRGNTDDNSVQWVADQIMQQAAQDKTIAGVMGWPMSAQTYDVLSEFNAKSSKLPILAACSTSDYLTGLYPYFFRICPTDEEQTRIAADFLVHTKKKKSIVTLLDPSNTWSENLARTFSNAMTNVQGNLVAQEHYTAGDQESMRNAFNDMLSHQPDADALFFAGYPADLLKLLNVLNANPQNDLLIMGASATSVTSAYPTPLPAGLDNIYFTSFASPIQWDNQAATPPFFQDYYTIYKALTAPNGLPSIDAGTMLAYDGLSTFLSATQQMLSPTTTLNPSALATRLRQITGTNAIQGISGRIAFDSIGNGNQDKHKMIFVEHIVGTKLVIDQQQGCLLKDNCNM
ncbi:MAG TPA: CHAT domain-containing protein [Ktedonosporobacter sp.]|nr:CHAT domain-containing protein [Ktedonosporobacter sp.]